MQTVCKFKCAAATPKDDPGPHSATFQVVYSGSPENERFFAATPCGSISLAVARGQPFEVGKEYYVTFDEAPPSAP